MENPEKIAGHKVMPGFVDDVVFEKHRRFQVFLLNPAGMGVFDVNRQRMVMLDYRRMNGQASEPVQDLISLYMRLTSCDWATFSSLLREHPKRVKGTVDIDSPHDRPVIPDFLQTAIDLDRKPSDLGFPSRQILTSEQRDATYEDGKKKYPLDQRLDIIAFLANHHFYHPMNSPNGGYVVAWDIKVRGNLDVSGAGGDYAPAQSHDKPWAEYLEKNSDDVFWEAARNAQAPWIAGTVILGDKDGFSFDINGRSGGHLILTSWPGPKPAGWSRNKMAFDGHQEYVDWLKSLTPGELSTFYRAVAEMDHYTSPGQITKAMNREISFIREGFDCQTPPRPKTAHATMAPSCS